MKTLARERDKQELLARLANLRGDSPRRWGRMSPHQMVCHLNDSFRVVTGERPAKPMTGLAVVFQRTLIKWIALWVPLRWPQGIPTRPEVDAEVGGSKPREFATDLAELRALLERMTFEGVRGAHHPVFGRMSAAATLRWGYLHVDHHLRQFGI